MRKFRYLLAMFVVLSAFPKALHAAVISINGTFAYNATSFAGLDLTNGSLALLVVDTSGNGFLNGGITAGQSLTVGSFLGGDDLVVGTLGSLNLGSPSADSFFSGSLSFDIDTGLTAAADTGDSFALIWFDGASTSTSTAAVGQYYQIGRATNWILPVAPITRTMGTNFDTLGDASGGSAGQTTIAVAAVPEPRVGILALVGALVLGMRRRRTKLN